MAEPRADREIRRQRFLVRVREWRDRQETMREIAVRVGLSPELYPPAEWRDKIRGDIPKDRANGRTTRMLLAAAADSLLDGDMHSLIVIHAHRTDYAKELAFQLQEWFKILGVDRFVKWIPGGDIRSYAGYDPYRTKFYCDHFVRPRPNLWRIGREWADNS